MYEKTLSTSTSAVNFDNKNYSIKLLDKKRHKENSNKLDHNKDTTFNSLTEPCLNILLHENFINADYTNYKKIGKLFKLICSYEKILKKLKQEFDNNQNLLKKVLSLLIDNQISKKRN